MSGFYTADGGMSCDGLGAIPAGTLALVDKVAAKIGIQKQVDNVLNLVSSDTGTPIPATPPPPVVVAPEPTPWLEYALGLGAIYLIAKAVL